MMVDMKQAQQMIASFIGKLLRDNFGKGPESVYVSFGHTFITVYLRNFLSPMERVLMEQDQEDIITRMRNQLMYTLLTEIRAFIEITSGVKLGEIYYDWNFHNKSGLIAGISSDPFPNTDPIVEDYVGRRAVDEEINKISQQAEKVPEETYSCELNPRTLIVIRNGILVRIEKEIIRQGYRDLLRSVKAKLEKGYLHNSDRFESILQKRVIDCFVDWDFELDKSLIVFVLNPKPLPGGNDLDLVDMS